MSAFIGLILSLGIVAIIVIICVTVMERKDYKERNNPKHPIQYENPNDYTI